MQTPWTCRTAMALIALATVLVLPSPASADLTVDFSASGAFGNSSSTETVQIITNKFGPVVLATENVTTSFTAAGDQTLNNVPATNGPISPLGTFNASDAGAGTGARTKSFGSFTLTLSQTQPGIGSQQDSATVTGTFAYGLGVGSTTLEYTFNSSTVQIGGVTYILGTGNSRHFQPLSTTSNMLSITVPVTGHKADPVVLSAEVVGTPVAAPEPSTMLVASVGAIGLIGYGLRRRKAQTA